jgi:hypothetical protein
MKPHISLPVFALDPFLAWSDLENAMEACVQYQNTTTGKILPLMLFAPMTEPENPDTWQPMKVLPENLLLVSIARSWDALMLKAFDRSRDVLGQPATVFPSVLSRPEALIADIYSAMAKSGMVSYKELHEDKDDLSFFFLRGRETIQAFYDSLRWLTKK